MTASGIKNRLMSLTKTVAARWDETKNYWKDIKCQEFEQRYMNELFATVDKTVSVLEKLDELLAQVRKDCE
jgi:hypothetical protein